MKFIFGLVLTIVFLVSSAQAQTAEVSVSLDERFFDVLLDAVFKNFNEPEFPLAENKFQPLKEETQDFAVYESVETKRDFLNDLKSGNESFSFQKISVSLPQEPEPVVCNETIRLKRSVNDFKTAVRFRDGKILAPIAFSGSYNPPLIGCFDFQGTAETTIDLEYDRQSRKLLGRVRVGSVNLGGVTNLASSVLARLIQGSIDRRINPVEILQMDKLSFVVPIQNANGSLKMNPVAIRHEITNGVLNIRVAYEFLKAN
jgi:hypothetical protein